MLAAACTYIVGIDSCRAGRRCKRGRWFVEAEAKLETRARVGWKDVGAIVAGFLMCTWSFNHTVISHACSTLGQLAEDYHLPVVQVIVLQYKHCRSSACSER